MVVVVLQAGGTRLRKQVATDVFDVTKGSAVIVVSPELSANEDIFLRSTCALLSRKLARQWSRMITSHRGTRNILPHYLFAASFFLSFFNTVPLHSLK